MLYFLRHKLNTEDLPSIKPVGYGEDITIIGVESVTEENGVVTGNLWYIDNKTSLIYRWLYEMFSFSTELLSKERPYWVAEQIDKKG